MATSKEFLESIGRAKTELGSASSPVGKVVQIFATDMIKVMKDNLASRNATGSLSQSLGFDFKTIDGNVELDFFANDYWDFINSGVDGTENTFGSPYSFSQIAKTQSSGLTFKESLTLWMASKGIVPEDGDFNSLAFVMMRSIKLNGITPNHFVDEALTEQEISKFQNDLVNAYKSMF